MKTIENKKSIRFRTWFWLIVFASIITVSLNNIGKRETLSKIPDVVKKYQASGDLETLSENSAFFPYGIKSRIAEQIDSVKMFGTLKEMESELKFKNSHFKPSIPEGALNEIYSEIYNKIKSENKKLISLNLPLRLKVKLKDSIENQLEKMHLFADRSNYAHALEKRDLLSKITIDCEEGDFTKYGSLPENILSKYSEGEKIPVREFNKGEEETLFVKTAKRTHYGFYMEGLNPKEIKLDLKEKVVFVLKTSNEDYFLETPSYIKVLRFLGNYPLINPPEISSTEEGKVGKFEFKEKIPTSLIKLIILSNYKTKRYEKF